MRQISKGPKETAVTEKKNMLGQDRRDPGPHFGNFSGVCGKSFE